MVDRDSVVADRLKHLELWRTLCARPRAATFATHKCARARIRPSPAQTRRTIHARYSVCPWPLSRSAVVEGTLVGVDGKQEHLQVDDLRTALGTYPAVTLRASDLLYVEAAISADDAAALLASSPGARASAAPRVDGVGAVRNAA